MTKKFDKNGRGAVSLARLKAEFSLVAMKDGSMLALDSCRFGDVEPPFPPSVAAGPRVVDVLAVLGGA